MRQDRTCKYCDITFKNEDGKVFANHVRWCDKNTSNGDKGIQKRAETNLEKFLLKAGELTEFTVSCKKCQSSFKVNERLKRHPEKDVYFCSRSCANSRGPRTLDFKNQVSSKLKQEKENRACQHCKVSFSCLPSNKQKFCSLKCSNQDKQSNVDRNSLKSYRQSCSFNFNLADFPDEFDFSLIDQYGWYRARNRGNNLNGVSRDHIVSVKYGYENGIDPKIIAHPANCQLLNHNDNVSKGKKCQLTIEQLKQKIIEWNTKYNT